MIRTKKTVHEGLISWLKYLDIEYLSDAEADRLAVLDINNAVQMQEAFRLAVLPEIETMNAVSKKSMFAILDQALSATEQELQPVFDRVGMPFSNPVISKHAFLRALKRITSEHQV